MNRQQQIDHFLSAAHTLAVARLRQQPSRLQEVVGQLARWRTQAGATRSDLYWDEWACLLAADLDTLREQVCADTEHAAALRNVSPMSVLLTQRERGQLLSRSRNVAAEQAA
jgi:hypothetical protein